LLQAAVTELTACVRENTQSLDSDVTNTFFEEDARLDTGVSIDPTIEVNGDQVRLCMRLWYPL
jgi:hypothetical protein